jgi:excisionase family DNA binding protein
MASSATELNGQPGGDAGDGAAAQSRMLLTAEEVAEMLGMGVDWVWEQSRRNRIPTVRLGRYRRYRREAIERWLTNLER